MNESSDRYFYRTLHAVVVYYIVFFFRLNYTVVIRKISSNKQNRFSFSEQLSHIDRHA